jgi:hypothetical protein
MTDNLLISEKPIPFVQPLAALFDKQRTRNAYGHSPTTGWRNQLSQGRGSFFDFGR